MSRNYYDNRSRGSENIIDEPPHSRLFILCSKDITEDELRDKFNPFGDIIDVRFVKDRNTGESKGVAYIKYSKTSSAAKAVEEMHGKVLPNTNKPIKVLVAANREVGSTKTDDPEVYLRLFIIVSKSADESDIRDHFKQFGEIDNIRIIKTRTNESKGVAYVKYFKMSHAARAYEECDRCYKAVFAKSREEKKQPDISYQDRSYGGNQGYDNYGHHGNHVGGPGDVINTYPNPEGFTKLDVTCCASLSRDQLYGLFGIVPGLDMIHPSFDNRAIPHGGQRLCVQYTNPQSASYARDKFHGFGYPPQVKMVVVPDFSYGNGSGGMPRNGAPNPLLADENKSTLQTLTKALAQATALLKSSGVSTEGLDIDTTTMGKMDFGGDDSFCSVRLPPVKPIVPSNSDVAKRLFVVSQPNSAPLYALKDAFARFGNLIDVFILPGKNYGYVSYADVDSADQAISTLHGAELYGSRLKVMEAEPPKNDRRDRKRQRMDE